MSLLLFATFFLDRGSTPTTGVSFHKQSIEEHIAVSIKLFWGDGIGLYILTNL